nr:MAG TPA: hypothetical protein [Caudoviricetes sp.]
MSQWGTFFIRRKNMNIKPPITFKEQLSND